jgi:hypothetical protein
MDYKSSLYAEMVFGNMVNVKRLTAEVPAGADFRDAGCRKPFRRSTFRRRTGIKPDEVKRFNPALGVRVPAQANLYLPFYVQQFGPDVSFWHRPTDGGLCGGAQRLPAYRRWNRPVARGVL